MTVHLICLRSDVLLRFALFHFMCILLTLVMLNCLDSPISFFNCGIRDQKGKFSFYAFIMNNIVLSYLYL